MKIPKSVASPKVEIPDGTHPAHCVAIEEKYLEEDNYGNHEKVVIKMRFDNFADEDGEPAVVEAMVNKKFNEKSTLFTYALALGVPADAVDALDTDDLIGKSALCVIKNEESARGGTWPRIKNMVPLPAGYSGGASVPSVVSPDGSPNWTVFYSTLKEKRGWGKGQIGDFLGLDMTALGKQLAAMDGPDAQDLMEVLLNAP